jgi:hypothetical protein
MTTQISPMLAVRDGRAAIAFYQQAFGATLLWELEGAVAGLHCFSTTLLACMGRRGRQEPSTIVPSRNINIRRLDRDRSTECCKARSSIHSDTCG